MNEGRPVGAVLALKTLRAAKTRLDLAPPLRERLALCMFLDALTALAGAVDLTVVVSGQTGLQRLLDRSGVATVVIGEDDGGGLNPAFARGEQWVRSAGAGRVLACVGDLPCLTPAAVRTVLDGFAASRAPRAFVPDAAGSGTTMLLTGEAPLGPRFQGASAAAHAASGAVALGQNPDSGRAGGWRRSRRDVDTRDDLEAAADIGLGPWTSTLIDPATQSLGRYTSVMLTGSSDDAGRPVVATEDGGHLTLAPGAVAWSASVDLFTRRRLHTVRSADRILTAW